MKIIYRERDRTKLVWRSYKDHTSVYIMHRHDEGGTYGKRMYLAPPR